MAFLCKSDLWEYEEAAAASDLLIDTRSWGGMFAAQITNKHSSPPRLRFSFACLLHLLKPHASDEKMNPHPPPRQVHIGSDWQLDYSID